MALKDVPIAKVAAGEDHSLFLHAKGDTIYACGKGGDGQLGIPRDQLMLTKPKDAAAAEVMSDSKREPFAPIPMPVAFPNEDRLYDVGRFVDISCGSRHSMAITTNGKIYSWGQASFGQVGNNPRISEANYLRPRLNEDWSKSSNLFVHQASCGGSHSLIVATRYSKEEA